MKEIIERKFLTKEILKAFLFATPKIHNFNHIILRINKYKSKQLSPISKLI